MNELNFKTHGVCVLDDFISLSKVNDAILHLNKATSYCQKIQKLNSIDQITLGTSHHLPAIDKWFLDLLIEYSKIDDLLSSIFGGKYILNSFAGIINYPKRKSYASLIHRDQRFFSGDKILLLNTFIPLCDFNEDNGATKILTKDIFYSNKIPKQDLFDKNSLSLNIKAGSLCIFDTNLWHCAGENKSNNDRPILTPMFSRPFLKQQYDFTSLVEKNQNPYIKQLLGFYSRVPKNLSEWYAKPSERCYQKDQDYDL